MATKYRTQENSNTPGSPNYCASDIWYIAHFTIYTLFGIMGLLILRLFASFYYNFILTDEDKYNPMYIGTKKSSKIYKV